MAYFACNDGIMHDHLLLLMDFLLDQSELVERAQTSPLLECKSVSEAFCIWTRVNLVELINHGDVTSR